MYSPWTTCPSVPQVPMWGVWGGRAVLSLVDSPRRRSGPAACLRRTTRRPKGFWPQGESPASRRQAVKLGLAVPTAELPAIVKERRPAPSPLLHERLDPCRGAAVGGAGQQLGGEPLPLVLSLGRQDVGPVHAGGLELPGPHVMPHRRLAHPVQIFGKPLIDLPVVEPRPGLAVNLRRAGLEQEHVPPVLKRRHVLVERLPVVGDDDDPAFRRELPRDALPFQAARIRMPGHGFLLLGLAQALEQA